MITKLYQLTIVREFDSQWSPPTSDFVPQLMLGKSQNAPKHTHTHTHTYIYIYIYMKNLTMGFLVYNKYIEYIFTKFIDTRIAEI